MQSELEQQTVMCASYAEQLPRVQEQLMRDLAEKENAIDKLKAENEKFKVELLCITEMEYIYSSIYSRHVKILNSVFLIITY